MNKCNNFLNQQVFSIHSGGTTGVTVKGPSENQSLTFCIEDRGTIRSIKFSPDNKILAIQRAEQTVEFFLFNENQSNLNETFLKKEKNSKILGFIWIQSREAVIVSNDGVELFVLIPEKRQCKTLKLLNYTINWFTWCALENFALMSSNYGNILTPVIIKHGTLTRLSKLECKFFIQNIE